MEHRGTWIGLALGIALGAALLLTALCAAPPSAAAPAAPTETPPPPASQGSASGGASGGASVCFWSAQGLDCIERLVEGGASQSEAVVSLLMSGPTPDERARGLRSAIPAGTSLERLAIQPDGVVFLFLDVPPEGLRALDHEGFERIVEQVAWTLSLASVEWRDLRIQTRHPTTGEFVPLVAFLPDVPPSRKETVLTGEEAGLSRWSSAPNVGQQPQGALSGKTVYISAGHGWQWNDYVDEWRTQRPPYPNPPYPDPIIEDHNNAEVVNQYLLRYLWNAGAQVWPARERDMGSAALVADDDDGDEDGDGDEGGYRETGLWATAAVTGTGYRGGDYRWTTTVTGTPTASATWTVTPPADGRYAVYVWYRPGADRATDARYTVHHAGGETVVAVDQRHHGLTWHYLGTFGFRGGEAAAVTLSNCSAEAGRVVVADAVRLGGGVFDDLDGIETAAPYPPNKPWWEVAAFYHVQRMGMSAPPGDVTARPIYARWEHAGTGDDAVYLSWHSNGATGYQTTASGSETYVHNGEWVSRTEGSLELAHAVHTELVHDLRAGWDAGWVDRGEKQRNLGELRLLWDDDPETRMPGALVEVAFHDHPSDTDALREPYFNRLAARAMYQGIVRYFEQRDGVDLALLPEPPTDLRVVNVGAGRVVVRWTEPLTDGVGLGGDAAVGYRVYTSTDGLGWSNGAAVTGTTAYTITGLAEGKLLFVRVTATNAGGESLPTEVLGARVGEAGLLLVNGFDRLDCALEVQEVDPVEGYNVRMLLERMNRYDYAVQYGEAITYPFDSASNEAVQTGEVGLGDYALVVWMLGEESVADETLSAAERAALTGFLRDGGALFLSGTEVGWDLDYLGRDPAFYNDVLRADYAGDDAGTYVVTPTAGAIFEGLSPFRFDAEGMYDADYPDQLLPAGGSIPALSYHGGLTGTAAVQYEGGPDGCERLVYFGFPFETIWPDQRSAVMGRALGFLGQCLPVPVSVRITTPVPGGVYAVAPSFAGTAEAGGGENLDRVEVQVQRDGDGWYWTAGEWTSGTTWLTATGTAVWSYPLPALADDVYTLRAQAWTVEGSGVGTPAEVMFTYDTLPPAAPALITPTGGVAITAPVSVTLRWEGVGPDGGSPVAYEAALDGAVYTTTRTAYTPTHVAGGWHTWGARAVDAAGHRSAWVTDTFRYPVVETVIAAPSDGSAHNRRPLFAGTAKAAAGVELAGVEVQIQRAVDGRYWVTGTGGLTGSAWISGSAWVTATAWVTAAGTADWSYPLPWLEDGVYHLRARAWTTDREVDLSPAVVSFIYDTQSPTGTVLITPTGGVILPARSEVTLVWRPVLSDTGSALSYLAELDGQSYTTTRTTQTVAQVGGGRHRWGVQVWDAAGNRSGWVTATFAIRRYDVWLPVVMRNLAPEQAAVLVNGGFETDEGWTLNQLAVYDTEQVHAGSRSGRVGIPPGEAGGEAASYSSVAQTFVVPSSADVMLALWAYPIGEGGDPDDWHYVSVRDESGVLHTLDLWQSDARVWEERVYALGDYRGQRVTLYLGVRNDGDDDTAALYLDDVSVSIEEVGR